MNKTENNYPKLPVETFRMFYQLQYDRIDKLETKRENFCNFILTLSTGLITYLLTNTESIKSNEMVLIISIIILSNITAIIFNHKTRPMIKMHQERAKEAVKYCCPKLGEIINLVPKPNSNKDKFRRSLVYSYLHSGIILISIISLVIKYKC
jgi:hypothetical protein